MEVKTIKQKRRFKRSYSKKSYVVLQCLGIEFGVNVNLVHAPFLSSLAQLTDFQVSSNYRDSPRLHLVASSVKTTHAVRTILLINRATNVHAFVRGFKYATTWFTIIFKTIRIIQIGIHDATLNKWSKFLLKFHFPWLPSLRSEVRICMNVQRSTNVINIYAFTRNLNMQKRARRARNTCDLTKLKHLL